MCFAPEADLIGGAVIGIIGVDALRHINRRREYLPLASLPIIFATHQLVETFVWWDLRGDVPSSVGNVAKWIYLLIAFVLLPTYVPAAVMSIEPPGRRRRFMAALVVLGLAVSLVLLVALMKGPVVAELADWHIDYRTGISALPLVVGAYIVSTCASLLFSGNRSIATFGIVNVVAIIVIAIVALDGLASLWCAWAAVASGVLALHLQLGESGSTGIPSHRRLDPASNGTA